MKKKFSFTHTRCQHISFSKKKLIFSSHTYMSMLQIQCAVCRLPFSSFCPSEEKSIKVFRMREKRRKKNIFFFGDWTLQIFLHFAELCYLQIIVHRLIVIHNIKIIQSYFVITSKALKPFVTMHDPASIIFMIILSIFHHYLQLNQLTVSNSHRLYTNLFFSLIPSSYSCCFTFHKVFITLLFFSVTSYSTARSNKSQSHSRGQDRN